MDRTGYRDLLRSGADRAPVRKQCLVCRRRDHVRRKGAGCCDHDRDLSVASGKIYQS